MKTFDSIPIPVGTLPWLGPPLHAHQASVAIVPSSSVGRLMPTAGDSVRTRAEGNRPLTHPGRKEAHSLCADCSTMTFPPPSKCQLPHP